MKYINKLVYIVLILIAMTACTFTNDIVAPPQVGSSKIPSTSSLVSDDETSKKLNTDESETNINKTKWESTLFEKEVCKVLNKKIGDVKHEDLNEFDELVIRDDSITVSSGVDLIQVNNIDTIEDIIYFKNIRTIRLYNNDGFGKFDLTPLSDLKLLRYLDCYRISTNDLTFVNEISSLISIEIKDMSLINLDFLKNNRLLEYLVLDNVTVNSVDAVSSCDKLVSLTIHKSNISSIEKLSGLKELQYVTLSHMPNLYNIGSLKNMTKLKTLVFESMPIESGKDIGSIATLEYLRIGNTNINDISFIENLKSLRALNIVGADIDDISSISELYELEALIIDITNVSDISPLKNLTKLSFLSLRDNEISDISVLSNLTNLKEVDLIENYITDLTPIAHVAKVNNRYKTGNGIGYSP